MKTSLRRTLAGIGVGGTMLVGGAMTAGSAQAADTGIPVLEAIKQCESGGDYTAVNPSSGASGAYQFLDSTWQSMDAAGGYTSASSAPESVQDAAAIELYTEQGTTPWLASQSCWAGAETSGTSSSDGSTTETSGTTSSTASTEATGSTGESTSGSGTTQTVSTGSSDEPAGTSADGGPAGERPEGAPTQGERPAGAPAQTGGQPGENCPR